jgi:hypothetical protein
MHYGILDAMVCVPIAQIWRLITRKKKTFVLENQRGINEHGTFIIANIEVCCVPDFLVSTCWG